MKLSISPTIEQYKIFTGLWIEDSFYLLLNLPSPGSQINGHPSLRVNAEYCQLPIRIGSTIVFWMAQTVSSTPSCQFSYFFSWSEAALCSELVPKTEVDSSNLSPGTKCSSVYRVVAETLYFLDCWITMLVLFVIHKLSNQKPWFSILDAESQCMMINHCHHLWGLDKHFWITILDG